MANLKLTEGTDSDKNIVDYKSIYTFYKRKHIVTGNSCSQGMLATDRAQCKTELENKLSRTQHRKEN
jgi:hypothetical protein